MQSLGVNVEKLMNYIKTEKKGKSVYDELLNQNNEDIQFDLNELENMDPHVL